MDLAVHQPVPLQRLQRLGEHLLADALGRAQLHAAEGHVRDLEATRLVAGRSGADGAGGGAMRGAASVSFMTPSMCSRR